MLKRTVTSIVFVLIIFPAYLLSGTVVFPFVVALLGLAGVYEMLGCMGMRTKWLISVPAYLLAVGAPFFVRRFASWQEFVGYYALILFAYLIFILAAGVFSHGTLDVEKIAASYMGVVYVITGFLSLLLLRDQTHGVYLLFMAMFGPWGSDVFAYLGGRFLGKHKLIPDVSPKKTVEGAISGMAFTGVAAVVFGYIVILIDPALTESNYGILFVTGLVISAVSQVGDLIASYIKRKYNIKDYGKILPGHGGILDRFDSVLCTVPAMFIITAFFHGMTFFH